jgi:hypothetical protein
MAGELSVRYNEQYMNNVFSWVTFRRAKGAVKLHIQYDVSSIPLFLHITLGSVQDAQAMDERTYEPGSFYIFDNESEFKKN